MAPPLDEALFKLKLQSVIVKSNVPVDVLVASIAPPEPVASPPANPIFCNVIGTPTSTRLNIAAVPVAAFLSVVVVFEFPTIVIREAIGLGPKVPLESMQVAAANEPTPTCIV